MEKWIECKISDIGTVVGGATPSTKKPENYVAEEYSAIFFKSTNWLCGDC